MQLSVVIAIAKAGSFADLPAIVNMPGSNCHGGVVYVKNGQVCEPCIVVAN